MSLYKYAEKMALAGAELAGAVEATLEVYSNGANPVAKLKHSLELLDEAYDKYKRVKKDE